MVLLTGIIISAVVISLTLVKTQKTVAWLSVLLNLLGVLQYGLLGEFTACFMSAIGLSITALIVVSFYVTSLAGVLNIFSVKAGFIVVYTVAFGLLNGGFKFDLQLLVYLGSVLMIAVTLISNKLLVKAVLFFAGVCWTVFQFNVGAYGNLVGQLFYFSALFWSVRFELGSLFLKLYAYGVLRGSPHAQQISV